LRLEIVLRFVLKLVFCGNVDRVSLNIIGQDAQVLSEILTKQETTRIVDGPARRRGKESKSKVWISRRKILSPIGKKAIRYCVDVVRALQAHGMQVVIARCQVPSVAEFIFNFEIGLLRVSIGKLPLGKPERKLLENGRGGIDVCAENQIGSNSAPILMELESCV